MPTHIEKLPNAPLQEVIFEIRWGVHGITGADSGYEVAVGKLQDSLRQKVNREPYHVSRFPEGIPLPPHIVAHQYWSSEEGHYPVFQLGKGIFTVNDVEQNYTWNTFRDLVCQGLKALSDAYGRNTFDLIRVVLQYIDAWQHENPNRLDAIRQAMNVNVEVSPALGAVEGVTLTTATILDDDSVLNINVQSSVQLDTRRPALNCQIAVSKTSDVDFNSLTSWLDKSHEITSETFKKLIKKEQYGFFAAS